MSSAYEGITLNKLVLETRELFQTLEEKDDFIAKVSIQGYAYNTYYDNFVYEIGGLRQYRVNEEFPKLTKRDLPLAICKAKYEISLAEIERFMIK